MVLTTVSFASIGSIRISSIGNVSGPGALLFFNVYDCVFRSLFVKGLSE